jgi:alkylated DNA repair dioxygenase AlkB
VTRTREDLGGGAFIELVRGFVADHETLLDRLARTLPLRAERIRIFGRDVTTPRLTSWHGDPGTAYRYSGRTFEPAPFTDELEVIRAALARVTGVRFNSVLANLYRNGDDSMGAHSDDERELGPTRDDIRIASVSLGAPRRFVLLPRRPSYGQRRALDLGEGSLLVMGGTTQRRYRHAVPKTRAAVGPRLNLTFRVVMPVADAVPSAPT